MIRRSRTRLAFFAFSIFVFFGSVSDALACRCVPASFKYRWGQSSQVLVGEVSEIKPLHKYAWSSYDDKPVEVTLKVGEYFKGGKAENVVADSAEGKEKQSKAEEHGVKTKNSIPDSDEETFVLHTSLQNLTCMGFPFEKEKKYLIFAYERKLDAPEPWSLYNFPSETYGVGGLCGGTHEYENPAVQGELKRIRAQLEAEQKRKLFSKAETDEK